MNAVGVNYNVAGESWSISVDTKTMRVVVTNGTAIVATGEAEALKPLSVVWDLPSDIAYAADQLAKVLAATPDEDLIPTDPAIGPFPPTGGVPFVPEPDAPIEP